VALRGKADCLDWSEALQCRIRQRQRVNENGSAILDHGMRITFVVDAVVNDEPTPYSRCYFLNALGYCFWFGHCSLLCVRKPVLLKNS
jgi:hypothetical protein